MSPQCSQERRKHSRNFRKCLIFKWRDPGCFSRLRLRLILDALSHCTRETWVAVRCGFLFQIVHLHCPVEPEGLRVLRTLLPSAPNPYGSKFPTDWGLPAPRFRETLEFEKCIFYTLFLFEKCLNRQNFAKIWTVVVVVSKRHFRIIGKRFFHV